MAEPYASNIQDPDAWEGMPAPASAGDPDEQMLKAARAGQDQSRAAATAPQFFPASQRAAAAPVTVTETDPAKLGLMGLQREMGAGDETMSNAREMKDDPDFVDEQNKKLEIEQSMHDLQSHAKDPEYKVGFGTRLLRGLRGVGVGLETGGLGGAIHGAFNPDAIKGGKAYGAPNDAYDTAMGKYTQAMETNEEQAGNTAANFKRVQDLRVARGKGLNEGAETYGRTVTGGADLAKLEDPEGKNALAVQTQTRRLNFANADPILSKPGYTRSRYLATGEVQPAREGTFEEQEYNRQVGQWQRANPNQKMTPEIEQQIYSSVRKPGEAGGNDAVGAIVADATGKKQEFINNYDRQPDGTYLHKGAQKYEPHKEGDILDAATFAGRVDQFRLDANKQLVKHGAQIGADGQVVSRQATGANPAANAPAAAAKQPPTPTQPPPPAAHDMARTANGEWHYRDQNKRDLGPVK